MGIKHTRLTRRGLGQGLAGALAMSALPVGATALDTRPPRPDAEVLGNGSDSLGRSSALVWINDQGPFVFAIDTAASGSVIAADLAQRLDLEPGPMVGVHTLAGYEMASSVRAARIHSGALNLNHTRLVIGQRAGLLGADGLIGTDLLSDLRITLSFRGGSRATIGQPRLDNASFFQGPPPTLRFADPTGPESEDLLILKGSAYGRDILAIIDTGAEVSIVNPAFASVARAERATFRDGTSTRRIHTPIGAIVDAQAILLPELSINGGRVRRLPVLMGDFHTFRRLGLGETPAMLMGIDVLRLYSRVIIDLRRRQIAFDW